MGRDDYVRSTAQAARSRDRGEEAFNGEAPARSAVEVKEKAIFGNGSAYMEIDEHLAGGYLTHSQVPVVRDLVGVVSNHAILQEEFGLDVIRSARLFHRRVQAFTMTSKSLGGFATKEAGTQRVHQDEKYMMEGHGREEGGGMFDSVKNWFAGGGGRGGGAWSGVLPSGGQDVYRPSERVGGDLDYRRRR